MTIASGLNFSTLSEAGIALNICNTIDTANYSGDATQPFVFGTKTIGLDASSWIYCKPAANYAIGTVGYIDDSFNFTAITATLASGKSGLKIGVMSQVSSVTATPTLALYDGLWVQTDGQCPAINVVASAAAFAQLYTSATAGRLTDSNSGTPPAINGIILTTANGGSAGNAPGVLNQPELVLTT